MVRAVFYAKRSIMANQDQPPEITGLKEKILREKAKKNANTNPPVNRKNEIGLALRIATEMAAALFVGGILGWAIDNQFETKPWGLSILLVLGAAAGMRGAFREASRLNEFNKDGEE